jgi:hypothetical protein
MYEVLAVDAFLLWTEENGDDAQYKILIEHNQLSLFDKVFCSAYEDLIWLDLPFVVHVKLTQHLWVDIFSLTEIWTCLNRS